MRNKASAGFLKQIIAKLITMAKAKTLAIKTKTRALKTRLVIFSLLQDRKILMTSLSHKLSSLTGQNQYSDKKEEEEAVPKAVNQKGIIVCSHNAMSPMPYPAYSQILDKREYEEVEEQAEEVDDENEIKYPDLTHSLFESEDVEFEDPGGSVIDIVKKSKQGAGEEFKLEDEIDRVADLFIRRFHRQIRMQKELSFKRHQEMLERSV